MLSFIAHNQWCERSEMDPRDSRGAAVVHRSLFIVCCSIPTGIHISERTLNSQVTHAQH